MQYVFDTNILIDYLKAVDPAIRLLFERSNRDAALYASEVTRAELIAGARQDEEVDLERFFKVFKWITIDESVSRLGGSLACQYHDEHPKITMEDYFIAATCIILDAKLQTLNVKDFPMFSDLERPY